MEEEKKKPAPSLPANYISILELRERWIKEKERKRKEEEEQKQRKQEIEEQLRIKEEEDLKKLEEQKKRKNSKKKKESGGGGEIRDVKSVGIVSERDDDGGLVKKKKKRNKGQSRKRYDSRKKRNHDVEENVCGESIVAEINTPVRDGSVALPVYVVKEVKTPVIRDYREEGREEAKGNGPYVMAIGTQFEDVVPRDEYKKTRRSQRKNKSEDMAVEENFVKRGTENKAPVKDAVQVYREKARCNGPRERAAIDDLPDIETQFDDEKKKKKKKKMGKNRKTKNQDVVAMEENVVKRGSESKNPVKDVVQVYREKAKGNGPSEKAVIDDLPGIETQFEDAKKKKKMMKKHMKKKNQDVVAAVAENVVECGTENKTPVKGVVQVYREKAKGNSEKAGTDAMETQFENLSIRKEETKDLKEKTRSGKSKKKKIQNVVVVEEENVIEGGTIVKEKKIQNVVAEDVVESGLIAKEKKTPVKGVIRVYREKVRQAKGNGSCEQAVTAIETQFENLSVKTRDLKAETRPSNQKRGMHFHRVAAPVVWVKKGQNERDGDGIGSGVKTLNA